MAKFMVMNTEKKGCLTSIVCIFILFLFFRCMPEERVYCIPKQNLYIRVSYTPIYQYGYIHFGKNYTDVFSQKDYLKIPAIADYTIVSMFLKTDNDTICYIPWDKIIEMKQTDFVFIEKEKFDSTIFNYTGKIPSYYAIKPEYTTTVELNHFEEDPYAAQDSSRSYKRLIPLN